MPEDKADEVEGIYIQLVRCYQPLLPSPLVECVHALQDQLSYFPRLLGSNHDSEEPGSVRSVAVVVHLASAGVVVVVNHTGPRQVSCA